MLKQGKRYAEMDFQVLFVVLSLFYCVANGAYTVNSMDTAEEVGTKWAVLVAGSSGWYNYRHQADICHAYQLLHNDGFPDRNIVVMMYDDIAYNTANPFQGTVFNRPNGTNMYEGIVKDYTRDDVTPENFLAVLQGQKEVMKDKGSGKVVDSGPNDRIFVNLVDHGGVGSFAFPTDFLHARKFVNAIKSMYRNGRFKEMVIYLESCESGSMFYQLLPDDINVYAMTASSPYQSSYACYYDYDLHTYVGDIFSVMWMEDTENENLSVETFDEQFNIVYKETHSNETTSRYGDLAMDSEVLKNFLGTHKSTMKMSPDEQLYYKHLKLESAFPSPDVPVRIIEEKLKRAKSVEERLKHKKELSLLLKKRIFLESKIKEIAMAATSNLELAKQLIAEEITDVYDWDCYEETLDYFHLNCFNLGKNTYALRFVKVFSKLCSQGYSAKELMQAMSEVCDHSPVSDII